MEPSIHINIGYLIAIFTLITMISGFLIWVLTLVLKHQSKQQSTDSTIVAMQKEINQLRDDKVSKIEIVTLNSKIDNVVEGLKNLTELIINLNNKNHPK